MEAADARRAVSAATRTVSSFGLQVDRTDVLNDSNRLVVRLTPCDTVARVTPVTHFASAELEVELTDLLLRTDAPVAALDPRIGPQVFVRDGFKITFWAHVASTPDPTTLPAADYADALGRLHTGLRQLDVSAPHVLDRIGATEHDVASPDVTPELADRDRELLVGTLRELSRPIVDRHVAEQVLHGEPHPGNVLTTPGGPLFIDFENAATGPVEYDLAWAPFEVAARCSYAEDDLLDSCRGIVLAIIATHRWTLGDRHPSGRRSGWAFLDAVRQGSPWPTLDQVTW
ncbi:phosphotransferase [Microlunatus soli]|uniref:Phosphotransferase enzyme family protein n=1 Tax=Microlunatus soli TaxID=630515 RepID=A0A1H1TPU9_9ACTN|nr:aminoglycoside phosphotransferase family protein [Microlunatus soli]SDS61966.1 Phosphotransferase enzyme family protein [Microlunatus soli]